VLADRFRVTWKNLGPHFGKRIGSLITREDCRAYHKAQLAKGYAPSTILTELALLRACLRWRYKNAAPSLWMPPASPARDHWLTKEEARRLMDAAETPHVKLFIILGLTAGARASAILDLTWDRVDLAHGRIDFRPAGRNITNKRRTVVPINPLAREALEEAKAGALTDHVIEYGGKPVGSIKKGLQRLSARTGIRFSAHTLRHTCAVWMAQENVPMQMISQYLGHTTIRTTEAFYARYSPAYMQDASAATMF
jgi:integrase